MNKHTPGPWEVVTHSLNEYWIGNGTEVVSKYGRIADCNAHRLQMLDQCRANARLIAAAPELLEALLGMVRGARDIRGINVEEYKSAEFAAAREAIAKAIGAQP